MNSRLGDRPRHYIRCLKRSILVFILSCTLIPQAMAQQGVLQGSAQYSANSGAIDPLLGPGNILDKDAARALLRDPSQESAIWAPIPPWEAGDWSSNQAVNTRAIKYTNGMAVDVQPLGVHTSIGKFNKGYLRDAKGTIWHLFNSDYWTETVLDDCTLVSYIVFCSPNGSPDYPDFYAESVDFKVAKPSNQILSVRKAKTWTKYTNLSDGTIKEDSLRTNFDQSGSPTVTSLNSALAKRIAPMASYEKSFSSNPRIVKSFSNYLKLHGLEALIPKQAATPGTAK